MRSAHVWNGGVPALTAASDDCRALETVALVAVVNVAAALVARQAGWFGADDKAGDPQLDAVELPATASEAYQQGQALLGRDIARDTSIKHRNFRRANGLEPDYPAAFAGSASPTGAGTGAARRDAPAARVRNALGPSSSIRGSHWRPSASRSQNREQRSGRGGKARQRYPVARSRRRRRLAARVYFRLRQKQNPEALDAVRQAVRARSDDWSLSLMEG